MLIVFLCRKFHGKGNAFCPFLAIYDLYAKERERFLSQRFSSNVLTNNSEKVLAAFEDVASELSVERIGNSLEFAVTKHHLRDAIYVKIGESGRNYECKLHTSTHISSGFPCECVIAVLKSLRLEPADFVDDYWKASRHALQYNESLFPAVTLREVDSLFKLRKNQIRIERVPEGPRRKGAPKKNKRRKSSVKDY
mmetsp:Transcript_17750/g.21544  ORF Transcript_17750/g.21544 Transcript_17750/m.21544 type:complete len:195 (-) Transcript_17750:36-620(-)